jgi:hypothetical protein
MKVLSASEKLVNGFLSIAQNFQKDVELVKVLKSRTYRIADTNVLIRAASLLRNRFFFGINYLTLEEISNLENPFIAFICGSPENSIIIPAKIFFKMLPEISHDRNGEYKIIINNDLTLSLLGKKNRKNLSMFKNNWDQLLKSFDHKMNKTSVEESLHSIVQGRLIEIGNLRGFKTYCPDKSKSFNDTLIADITKLKVCPELQFSEYNLLRNIDVIWFREKNNHYIPVNAFEVEISTGTWSGVGRMATLYDYSDVGLYIISNNKKKFVQVFNTFPDFQRRYKHIDTIAIGDLYSSEKNLKDLRYSIGL